MLFDFNLLQTPNGISNGVVVEEDLKDKTSPEAAVSSSNGDHKELDEPKLNGQHTDKQHEPASMNSVDGSVKAKSRRNGKSRKSDLEV